MNSCYEAGLSVMVIVEIAGVPFYGGLETMARARIRNDQWKRIQDVIPCKATDSGGTAKYNRLFLEAVLWIARTGSPWRDLPREFGNWHATFTRFSRWRRKGVWQRVIEAISGDVELESLLHTLVRTTGKRISQSAH